MRKKVKFPRPRFTWDKEYGLGYVYLSNGTHYETRELLTSNGSFVIADLDKEGNILGVEIIS